MDYSILSIVALVIHILINFDMFTKINNDMPAIKSYRFFAISIAVFYITDILWGIFDTNAMRVALYTDTFVYFIAMGATIFFWTEFVVRYLEGQKIFTRTLTIIGALFFATELVLLIVNIFQNLLFDVDLIINEQGKEVTKYTSYDARDAMLWAQVAMYSLVTIYSFAYTFIKNKKNLRRHIAVSLFSIVAIVVITLQVRDPLTPYYPIGLLVGTCIINTYAISDTKQRFKEAYQKTSVQNEENKEKLGEALSLAYTDSLTGVKSKHAYVEIEEQYDRRIANNEVEEFAIIVFDLNGLKTINDTLGHKAGDDYIIEAVRIIENCFPTDQIYRFGGDEFVVILEGEIYANRQRHLNKFMSIIEENAENESGPVVSSGISKFRKGIDNTFRAVFYRADKMMYSRKEYLKENIHHSSNDKIN